MIKNGILAEYPQVEMMLGTLPTELWANVVMTIELDSRDPTICRYDKL
jgi:hypothetical protein